MTKPDRIVVCDGSDAERDRLTAESVAAGELIELNQQKLPGCYLHRSAPHDVARTEHLTFICTERQDDAGPNNNWMPPGEARTKLADVEASEQSKVGVQGQVGVSGSVGTDPEKE